MACEIADRVAGRGEKGEPRSNSWGEVPGEAANEIQGWGANRLVKRRAWSAKYPVHTRVLFRRTSRYGRKLFVRFSAKSTGDARPGFSEMRRRGMNIDGRFGNFRQRVNA